MTNASSIALTEHSIEGTGGKLHVRQWDSETQPLPSLVICPGFNAHSGHYARAAEVFTARGIAVTALDLRGRGQSDGERFFVDTFDDYVSDLSRTVDFVRMRAPDRPLFVLGHSAGGIVATSYALRNQQTIAGLICESFAYRLPAPAFALTLMRGASYFLPHTRVIRLNPDEFSRDPAWLAYLRSDPLLKDEVQPIRTVAALARMAETIGQEFEQLLVPLLVLHGTADRATLAGGSREFLQTARSTDKTLKLYDGHYHDLLNDLGRDQVTNDIGNWILERASRAPRPAEAVDLGQTVSP